MDRRTFLKMAVAVPLAAVGVRQARAQWPPPAWSVVSVRDGKYVPACQGMAMSDIAGVWDGHRVVTHGPCLVRGGREGDYRVFVNVRSTRPVIDGVD